uniref:Uncharacterized protein n=1 Tax=Ditylenchus dipsaci TaxID=166011 RepID=A0A915CU70_9BILA
MTSVDTVALLFARHKNHFEISFFNHHNHCHHYNIIQPPTMICHKAALSLAAISDHLHTYIPLLFVGFLQEAVGSFYLNGG